MDLFSDQRQEHRRRAAPLAVRMRPASLDEFVGQPTFFGEGRLLRRMLEADRVGSSLFYGPPGTGKTTLAMLIAESTRAHFERVNGAGVGVKEVRRILDTAKERLDTTGGRTILFVDELHRFNRAQQDVLLDDVEDGGVILIGATTENPFFSVKTPLLSRCQIFQFEPLSSDDLKTLLFRALADEPRGLGAYHAELTAAAADLLAVRSDGDARRALTALEIAVVSQAQRGRGEAGPLVIDEAVAAESIRQKVIRYDAAGDQHHNLISAMIKSIRASDPDAAVYWLARMLEGGEDPRFLARRIVIAAAEDIGNADPRGLVLAQAAAEATNLVGLPECELPLAQAVIYLACCPKSNASAKAIWAARRDVRTGRTVAVPRELQSTAYEGARKLGAGEGYRYPHDAPDGIVPRNDREAAKTYYEPTDRGDEARLAAYLDRVRRRPPEKSGHEGERPASER